MKFGSMQALAFVGVGGLLGFLAGNRDLVPSLRADGVATSGRPAAGSAGPDDAPGKPPCCSEGTSKGQLLAQALAVPATTLALTPHPAAPAAPAAPAKQPNILVIMADDVGWFNIGAYHRGMMAGKTPHLDRMAAQGMLQGRRTMNW